PDAPVPISRGAGWSGRANRTGTSKGDAVCADDGERARRLGVVRSRPRERRRRGVRGAVPLMLVRAKDRERARGLGVGRRGPRERRRRGVRGAEPLMLVRAKAVSAPGGAVWGAGGPRERRRRGVRGAEPLGSDTGVMDAR